MYYLVIWNLLYLKCSQIRYMAEEQITVYDAETQQPVTVTVNTSGDNGSVQTIQYITSDGQVAQLQSDVLQVNILKAMGRLYLKMEGIA